MRKELHKNAVYNHRFKRLVKKYKYRRAMQREFFRRLGYDVHPPARKEHLDALGLVMKSWMNWKRRKEGGDAS
ncbi:hypothetical protein [uncultured Selenomonas sp.]|uniref:hypothetical protein n=1 Tax=uncultured Selenomonas sp. TaxID=159275 RepID=UPI0025F03BFF|nr:hypothetical protein [uncultured Selenomonas sp.]